MDLAGSTFRPPRAAGKAGNPSTSNCTALGQVRPTRSLYLDCSKQLPALVKGECPVNATLYEGGAGLATPSAPSPPPPAPPPASRPPPPTGTQKKKKSPSPPPRPPSPSPPEHTTKPRPVKLRPPPFMRSPLPPPPPSPSRQPPRASPRPPKPPPSPPTTMPPGVNVSRVFPYCNTAPGSLSFVPDQKLGAVSATPQYRDYSFTVRATAAACSRPHLGGCAKPLHTLMFVLAPACMEVARRSKLYVGSVQVSLWAWHASCTFILPAQVYARMCRIPGHLRHAVPCDAQAM